MPAASPKTLKDLDWQRLVEALNGCRRLAKASDEPIPLAADAEEARAWLGELGEAMRTAEAGEPLPLGELRDLRPHLDRIARGGVLDAAELWEATLTLESSRRLRRFLLANEARLPRLRAVCATDPGLDALEEQLRGALLPDGSLADHASADLSRLRRETAALRARIVARLEEMIRARGAILQEPYYTQREGRYVLPVRRDAHEKLPGIVHGSSGSGATIFVEPRGLVAQGNRLKMAQAEMEREERRILALLSDALTRSAPELRALVEAMDRADRRAASAALGAQLDGVVLELLEEPRVALRATRHPLLLLEGIEVVANDVELASGAGLLLSGPNAGGKTITLKVLGLAALANRAGLPFPAAPGSGCGFFSRVLTDIGDAQSVSASLSTFSGHIRNLVGILEASAPGALVLLDELAGGTDPEEGAALACALADAFMRRGAALALTTHYEPLKAMAAGDARLRNASVGFDVAQMAPTYVLRMDVPGASSALEVAQRFGMPAAILDAARGALPEKVRSYDALVRDLEEQGAQMRAARVEAETLRAQAEEAHAAAARALEEARGRGRGRIVDEAKATLRSIQQAHAEVHDLRKQLRRQVQDAEAMRGIRARLEARALEAQQRLAEDRPPPPERARLDVPADFIPAPGQEVWARSLGRVARVVEPAARGKVKVSVGPMCVTLALAELMPLEAASTVPRAPSKPRLAPARASLPETASSSPQPPALRTSENTLDLRGLRVDEALGMTESFLDRLYGASESTAFLLHGHGTGALRQAIREYLQAEPNYVESFRSGSREEGGEGVTVVSLR